jgi:hypothetical protein
MERRKGRAQLFESLFLNCYLELRSFPLMSVDSVPQDWELSPQHSLAVRLHLL